MDVSLIFVAIMAVLVCYQLYATLGRRDGHEPEERDRTPMTPPKNDSEADAQEELMKEAAKPVVPQPAWAQDIIKVWPDFDGPQFIDGAKAAYEMIVNAFASGKLRDVKPYVEPSVYRAFESAVAARDALGQTSDLQFVGISKAEIITSDINDTRARITVEFESDQTRVVRDKDENVVEGDPNRIDLVRDRWTFSKSLKNRDPNWLLVATGGSASE